MGALGPAPEDPDLSACLADLRRAWASAPADPVFSKEVWVLTDADPGPPEIQVGVSEDTQLKSVRQLTDLTHVLLTILECKVDVGEQSLRLYQLSGFWERDAFFNGDALNIFLYLPGRAIFG